MVLNNFYKSMLLNYQRNWIQDTSQIKIWEKSRQIGASFVQAYEDVRDCATGKVRDVWYSSADESAAAAYIKYCKFWIELFDKPLSMLQTRIATTDEITTMRVSFANNATIHALSSNPKNFRSKRGKVVLDEFAFHADAVEMWNAAKPVTTWGFDLRIISSHFTTTSLFYQFVKSIRSGTLDWSLHRTTVTDAVSDGLVSKILGRESTETENNVWIEEIRRECFNDATFQREYMCTPDGQSNRLFTPDELNAAVCRDLPAHNPQWIGIDLGRYHDPTEIVYLTEFQGAYYITRVEQFRDTPLSQTERYISDLIKSFQLRGVAIDNTGLGQSISENLQNKFPNVVIPYTFTTSSKETLALRVRDYISQNLLYLPSDISLLQQYSDTIILPNRNSSFSIHADQTAGHNSDKFWASSLALHAAVNRQSGSSRFAGATRRADPIKSVKLNLSGKRHATR